MCASFVADDVRFRWGCAAGARGVQYYVPPAKFIPATEPDFFLFTCEISFPEEFPLKFAARSAENLSWIPLFKADHGS